MKVLSFIIPLYNSSQWLRKCLDSVLKQDIPLEQMEVICVNDGSPDNSADIACEYGKKYPNTILVLNQENQGPAGARNNGIRHAKGKYLCFVDPDDYVEQNVYGRLVLQMEEENLDMLRFNYQSIDENNQPVNKPAFENHFDYSPKLMSGAEFIATRLDIACNIWRYIYRREIITKNELYCFAYGNYDDTPWLPLVLMKVKRMNVSNTVVYDYIERENSLVRSTSPRRVKQQLEGALQLICQFEKNKANVIDIQAAWRQGIIDWYRSIQSFCALSYLQNVSRFCFDERRLYIKRLKEIPLFPLYIKWASFLPKLRRKMKIANIDPYLLVWLLHKKYNAK